MQVLKHAGLALAAVTIVAGSASARKIPSGPPPAQITGLIACRAIAAEAQRLACYDKAAATIDTAVAAKDIVVIDREGVAKTKKGLFGFGGLPNLGIFGDDDDSVQITQIDGIIAGLGKTSDGGYIVRLEDGSKWQQTDSKTVYDYPRIGDKVTVKKGVMTSYFMNINGKPGFKVRRIA